MTLVARLAVITLGVGVLGCSEPATLIGNACEAGIAPTVSQTAPPEFQWTPACDIGTLLVTTEAGDPVWQVSSDPQADHTPTNRIHRGVIYGVLPPESYTSIEPKALVPGQTYRLNLIVTDSQGEETHVGAVIFTLPAQ